MASFWQALLTLLFKGNSPEAIKKRSLKAIAKQIRLTRNGKFYRTKTKELTPVCARFFYDVYKTVSIAQVTMQALIKSTALRNLILEYYLGREILDQFESFSPENIAERAKTADPKRLTEELRTEFESLKDAIDPNTRVQIDSCYNLILSLGQFVSFDFYALIKRFGFSSREHSFNAVPQFTSCKADMVITMLQDFVDYIAALDPSQDWKTVLRLLKSVRNGSDLIVAEQWFRLLLQFQEMLHSGVLHLIIQHVTEDTKWKANPQIPEGRIFSAWLESRQQTMEGEIARVAAGQWISQVGTLSREIFGNTAVDPLKYYNERIAELFAAKGFEGFTHTEALNYMMAFLRQVFAKDIQEFCDLLVIRAQWNNISGSQALSSGWNAMQTITKRLDEFDDSLSNDGINGSRLIGALARLDRDRSQGRIIREMLNAIDNEAMEILLEAVDSLAGISKIVEFAKNDYFQNPRMLILNWREIEIASHRNMAEWLRTISNKLEKFITLARLLIGQ
ncbi:MAG: DUF5312 domain-containing protein [Treponema sp.]|jgi:hypothetical protein|nr:DUF5312 domain-containing protein [Treponema sp.]